MWKKRKILSFKSLITLGEETFFYSRKITITYKTKAINRHPFLFMEITETFPKLEIFLGKGAYRASNYC